MKKYLFGVFAIALAVGFSAYTNAPKKDDPFWYKFQSGNNTTLDFDRQDATPSITCNDPEPDAVCTRSYSVDKGSTVLVSDVTNVITTHQTRDF